MKAAEFTDALATGHEGIDGQHKRMFAWANRILLHQSWNRELLVKAISFLLGYVRFHFQAEEHLMDLLDYPKTKHHHAHHEALRNEAEGLRAAAFGGEEAQKLLARVHHLFDEWYRHHILTIDLPFATFVREWSGGKRFSLPTSDDLVDKGLLHKQYRGIEHHNPGERGAQDSPTDVWENLPTYEIIP